jgi:2-polyprenyl-6-methoxyphenol hydroxylase-like FAD-dependent oxidoreductase
MQATPNLRALVIGGGIAGLAAARALRRAGVEAVVFERAGELRKIAVGGGLILWHNAMRAFQQLDMLDEVLAVGPQTETFEFRSWRGGLLARWPVGEMGRRQFGAPTISVSRADLHPALTAALDEDALQLGAACTGFEQDEAGVTARFADGREERGDLLIGADGFNSTIRKQLLGDTTPRRAPYSLWQAGVEGVHDLVPVGLERVLWGRGTRFVFHHGGGDRLYWTALFDTQPHDTTETGEALKAKLLERYRGWYAPTEAIIAATPAAAIGRLDILDREPVKRWGEGRVTLLGDAAHPMAPNVGQGACQALEDGIVLARCLGAVEKGGDAVGALRAYEALRMERTAAMTNESWSVGALARWANPLQCVVRDQVMRVGLNSFQRKRHERDMAYQF